MMIERILAFVARNRGAVFSQLIKQAYVRFWISCRVWRFTRIFTKVREPKAWVFMGGCYNSGTSILREMIGAHPEVASLPREGVAMTDAFPNMEKNGWVRMWHRNAKDADLVGQDPKKLASQAKRDWKFWWGRKAMVHLEKSIVHGAWMPALDQGFENARFIGVVRNGYCACEGIRRRAKPNGQAAIELASSTYPIEEVGQQWVFANQRLLSDREQLSKYTQIHYENFTQKPVETIKSIFRFIGVSDACVSQDANGTITVGSREFTIVDQNEKSLSRLSDEDKKNLHRVIGNLMMDLGYDEFGSAFNG